MSEDEKDRREFLKNAALFATFPFASVLHQPGASSADIKFLEYKQLDLPDGQVLRTTVTINGVEVRSHILRVEEEKTYHVFTRIVSEDKSLTFMQFIDGTKGEQKGDRRLDTMRITQFRPDGTAIQQEPRVVAVVTSHPYAGLSPEEMLRRFREDKAAGRWD